MQQNKKKIRIIHVTMSTHIYALTLKSVSRVEFILKLSLKIQNIFIQKKFCIKKILDFDCIFQIISVN